jgi:hypothetical protein
MRTLHPIFALGAMFVLPMTIAQEGPPPKPADAAPAPVTVERETHIVRLQHAKAFRIFGGLKSILSAEPAGPASRVFIEFDAASNAIILSGPASELRKARAVIDQLDIAPVEEARQTHLIRLQHALAPDLAKIVSEMVHHRMSPGRSPSEVPGVTVDGRSNTLVITADAADFESIRKIIEGLDVPPNVAAARSSVQPARARVSVYRISVPSNRAASLRPSELSEASDDAALTSKLEKLGTSKLLYVMDQGVDLGKSPTMSIASSCPFSAGSVAGKDGQRMMNVSYQDVGCIVNMEGEWPADTPEAGEANIEVEISHVADTDLQIAPDARASKRSKVRQHFAGPFESSRPIILLSLEAGAEKDTTTAYVTRIELRREQAGAAKT